VKKKGIIKLNEQKYHRALEPLNGAISLLNLQDGRSLGQLVTLGKRVVKRIPNLPHGHIILTFAYYRQKEYDRSYEASLKASKYRNGDHNIIPVLQFAYEKYENYYKFVNKVAEIFKEEMNHVYQDGLLSIRDLVNEEKSRAWKKAVDSRLEHPRQVEILDNLSFSIKVIAFKNLFVYPELKLLPSRGFHEILDLCGLDAPFHVQKSRFGRIEHIFTDSDRSLTVYTNYDPNWGGFIVIKGEPSQIFKFNSLLFKRLETIASHDYISSTLYRIIPHENEWVTGGQIKARSLGKRLIISGKRFQINEERVRSLSAVLDASLDILKLPKLKDHIIGSFKFENKATLIELYIKEAERKRSFIQKLEKYFFVGEVSTSTKSNEPQPLGIIMVSRFKNLVGLGTQYAIKNEGSFGKEPILQSILFDSPCKRLIDHPSEVEIKSLVKVINRYSRYFQEYGIEDAIVWAFTSEKPVTEIDLICEKSRIIKRFMKDLQPFFFVRKMLDSIFVSRYKILIDIISSYSRYHNNLSDLLGFFLLDLPPSEVAYYCSNEDQKPYNLVK